MVEARVDNGLGEEQKRVQVTFPNFFRIILSECYQQSAFHQLHVTVNLCIMVSFLYLSQ